MDDKEYNKLVTILESYGDRYTFNPIYMGIEMGKSSPLTQASVVQMALAILMGWQGRQDFINPEEQWLIDLANMLDYHFGLARLIRMQ